MHVTISSFLDWLSATTPTCNVKANKIKPVKTVKQKQPMGEGAATRGLAYLSSFRRFLLGS